MPAPADSPADDFDLEHGATLRGLRPGQRVFDRYALVRQVGRGGMGVVWQARDTKLDLDMALKFLPEELVGDAAALADLRHETRRCMKLHHTHIVHVYDLVDDPHRAAIAMEFIDGMSLSALRAEKPGRVLKPAELQPLLLQICTALTYAHDTARVVHRDLKPANLMVTRDGQVKVMDFGIASSLSDSMSRYSVAKQPAASSGTLPYMSPQQLLGFPPSVADDIYALGATIYELLTSKPPFFRGDVTRQIETIVPPSMADRRRELEIDPAAGSIPAIWEEVIAACLDKAAAKRPQRVVDVWRRLTGTATASAPPPAQSAPPPQTPPTPQAPPPMPPRAASAGASTTSASSTTAPRTSRGTSPPPPPASTSTRTSTSRKAAPEKSAPAVEERPARHNARTGLIRLFAILGVVMVFALWLAMTGTEPKVYLYGQDGTYLGIYTHHEVISDWVAGRHSADCEVVPFDSGTRLSLGAYAAGAR